MLLVVQTRSGVYGAGMEGGKSERGEGREWRVCGALGVRPSVGFLFGLIQFSEIRVEYWTTVLIEPMRMSKKTVLAFSLQNFTPCFQHAWGERTELERRLVYCCLGAVGSRPGGFSGRHVAQLLPRATGSDSFPPCWLQTINILRWPCTLITGAAMRISCETHNGVLTAFPLSPVFAPVDSCRLFDQTAAFNFCEN